MSLRDVEGDCADILAAADLDLTLATDLFSGPAPQVEGLCVSCKQSGGDVELLQSTGAVFSTECTVLVEAPRASYREAKLLADAVWSALWLVQTEQYIEIKPADAGPSYLGPDGNGRHVFSVNVTFVWNAETAPGSVVPLTNGAFAVDTLQVGTSIIFPDDSVQLVAAPTLAEIAAIYLSQANAAATYETIANAAATYQTQAGLAAELAPYLTSSDAAATYATLAALGSYLTSADAASTYATLAGLAGYLPLAGGTLTGGLVGTTAAFGGNMSANNDGANRVVLGSAGDPYTDYPGIWFGSATPTIFNYAFLYEPNALQTILGAPSGGAIDLRIANVSIARIGSYGFTGPSIVYGLANTSGLQHGLSANGKAAQVSGNAADGASAVGVISDNANALTTGGAKIHSFRNAGTEKAFHDKDGQLEQTVAGKGVVLKSPDGTRYLLTVANGGTLSITAA